MLYTCEDAKHVRHFPKLSGEINIDRKVAQKEAIDFIEQVLLDFFFSSNFV